MDNFQYALEQTLKHEGGYNEVKGDAGGATNYGISLRFLKDLHKTAHWVDFDKDGDIDAQDIKKLTKADASKIYYTEFWLKNKCDKIIDVNIAAKLFDMSVNMGCRQAARLIQSALKLAGYDLTVDGILGPKTIEAINKTMPTDLKTFMVYQGINFYLNLVQANPAYEKFIKGWLKRAVS